MADRYFFSITISGTGDTPEEAWDDAVAALVLDPGEMPEFTMEDPEDG